VAADDLDNISFGEILQQAAPEDLDSWQDISLSLLETLFSIWSSFVERLPYILLGLTVILVTWAGTALVNKAVISAARRAKTRHSLAELFSRLATMTVWIIGFLLAAMVMFPGLTPSKALGGLGLISVAVGLAFKDIFENFFAGMLILWKFPFENGDFVELETDRGMVAGEVVDVQLRMTLIREISNELRVVPNAEMYKAPLRINTWKPLRRDTLKVQVPYAQNIPQAREVLLTATKSCNKVESSPEVYVFANEFAESGVEFSVHWWTGSAPLTMWQARDEVIEAVKQAFDDAGIEIPYPHRKLLGTITNQHTGQHAGSSDDPGSITTASSGSSPQPAEH